MGGMSDDDPDDLAVDEELVVDAGTGKSKKDREADLKAMMDSFEKHTKPTFKGSNERSFIKFGSMRDKDPDFGIRSGQLVLE